MNTGNPTSWCSPRRGFTKASRILWSTWMASHPCEQTALTPPEKRKGGGVGVYVSDKWCKQFTVKETICSPDVELLCLSMRPHYLPRQFGNIIIAAVYVPPSGNAGRAAACIAECAHKQLQRAPGAPVLFLGDFVNWRLPCQALINL